MEKHCPFHLFQPHGLLTSYTINPRLGLVKATTTFSSRAKAVTKLLLYNSLKLEIYIIIVWLAVKMQKISRK